MGENLFRLRRLADDALICHQVVMGESFLQRFFGLMGRASLGDGEGLYLATSSIHMFFMRFAIDAVFISKANAEGHRRVVAMRPDLPPWRGLVLPVRGAEGVVEMRAGVLAQAGVTVGDEVVLEALP